MSARSASKTSAASQDRLPSGARLFVETDAAIPLVDVDVVLRGGSIHDPVDREGLTRLYARLLRRGTSKEAHVGAHSTRKRKKL
jgi:zinc protease